MHGLTDALTDATSQDAPTRHPHMLPITILQQAANRTFCAKGIANSHQADATDDASDAAAADDDAADAADDNAADVKKNPRTRSDDAKVRRQDKKFAKRAARAQEQANGLSKAIDIANANAARNSPVDGGSRVAHRPAPELGQHSLQMHGHQTQLYGHKQQLVRVLQHLDHAAHTVQVAKNVILKCLQSPSR